MHATLVWHPFTRGGWGFENKLDGFRALARRELNHVELLSRTGRSIGPCFPEIANASKRVPGEWVLDGELVVPDARGHPSFELVRRRGVMTRPKSIVTAAAATPAAFCVFHALFVGDADVRSFPWPSARICSAP